MKDGVIIYHRVDFDGVFSASIAEKWINENPEYSSYELFGYTYGDEIPDAESWAKNGYDSVIMVDISFPADYMNKYRELWKSGVYSDLIWIDHHITAIQDSISHGYSDLPGLRGLDSAACEYSWIYFFGEIVPDIIQLLSAYDIWNKTRFDWGNCVLPLQYALKAKYGVNQVAIAGDFGKLIWSSPEELNSIIESGKLILKYLERTWKSAVKVYSFEITVAGRYKGIAMMSSEFSSNLFQSVMDKYDVYCVVNRRDKGKYACSLYIEPGRIESFNAGEYLKANYGGGGHRGAAGCVLGQEQFERLINNCEI